MMKQECEILALQYLDSLYGFALLLTGERHRAEGLVYETYRKASRSGEPVRCGTHSKSALFTIMYNTFVTQHYQGAKEAFGAEGEEGEDDGYESPPDREFLQVGIERTLSELPKQLKTVLALKEVFEFDYQEIARVLGCPAERVQFMLWRVRNLLKKRLKRCCQGLCWHGKDERRPQGGRPLDAEPRLRACILWFHFSRTFQSRRMLFGRRN